MVTCVVAKCYHIMDVHMKTWTGYGKTRLSTVTFPTDPVPTLYRSTRMDIDVLRNYECDYEPATDFVIVPPEGIEYPNDVWTFVAIE